MFWFLPGKKNSLLLLFFIPLTGLAQSDSTIFSDTLETFVEEAPPPPEVIEEGTVTYQEKENENENENQDFKYTWETDSLKVLQRKVPDDHLKKMQEDDAFWYANTDIKIDEPKENIKAKEEYVPLGKRKWFQVLLWLVIIGSFAAILAMYLAGSNVGLFQKKSVPLKKDDGSEEIPEDIFAINYQKEIDKAAANGNYRLAIRLMFLRMLKQLAEKNIIQYKHDRTNFDYLVQLRSTGYYNNFFRITRNYEYSWYGKFPVSEDAYKIIRSDFNQFDRQLQ